MSSVERKIRQKEALRSGILEAARNIAIKESWQAVTIRKIADEVEYTPPIVYEFFENKEAVLFEVAMEGFRLLRSKLEEEEKKEPDPKQRLVDYAKIYWAFAEQYSEYYRLMFGLDGLPSLTRERPKEVESTGELIRSTIRAIAQGTEVSLLEIDEFLFQWMCIVNGFITITLIMRQKIEEKGVVPEEFLERASRRFIKSIQ
jgi:AcrR family transcriptional regulator